MKFIKVRKKPIEVEAFQLTGEMLKDDMFNKCKDNIIFTFKDRNIYAQSLNFIIETLEGDMKATCGDWIIKGVQDEIYPCRKDIFEATYDLCDSLENTEDN